MALDRVGSSAMSWGEAIRLTIVLSGDPSSHFGAAINGMHFPVSRDYLALQRLNANFMARYTEKRAKFLGLQDPFELAPRRFRGTPMSKAQLRTTIARHRASAAAVQDSTIIQGG